MTPIALNDFAVLGALHRTPDALSIDQVVTTIANPPVGPGIWLSPDSVRRIITRLHARGLVESVDDGEWRLTRRGRVLWAAKGTRFTL